MGGGRCFYSSLFDGPRGDDAEGQGRESAGSAEGSKLGPRCSFPVGGGGEKTLFFSVDLLLLLLRGDRSKCQRPAPACASAVERRIGIRKSKAKEKR